MRSVGSKLLFNENITQTQDRRASRRREASAALRFTSFEDRNCVALDVSAGGARVLSARRFEEGDDFTLVVGLPRCGQLALKGRVVWIERDPEPVAFDRCREIGVGFCRAAPDEIDLLRRYI